MSDAPTDYPVLAHLHERKRELEDRITDARARLGEVEYLLATLSDERTRVRRKLKEAPIAAASEPFYRGVTYTAPEPPEAA